MNKRIMILFLLPALAITAVLALFSIMAPIQAAPFSAAAQTFTNPSSMDETAYFAAFLGADQEVPAGNTDASGVARFTLNDTTLEYELAVRDITDITASHIHIGATGVNGPADFPLYTGTGDFDPANPISGTLMLTEDQVNNLRAGNYYVNVHTTAYPSGEIRGQIGAAKTTTYQTMISGAKETAAVDSRASGHAFLTLSADMTRLYYRVLVDDIEDISAAHIHEAPAGANGGVVFTLYDGFGDFDAQNPVSGMLSPSIVQVATMLAGDHYINVHTSVHPTGEIRGQVAPFTPPTNFHALLDGSQRVRPIETTAVAVGRFQLAADLSELSTYVAVDDISDIIAAHLHTGQPGQTGEAAYTLFTYGSGPFGPGNPISGVLTIDAQTVLDLVSGHYYANIHTADEPAGEIRGQVVGASPFVAMLSGTQQLPPVATPASGKALLAVNDQATKLHYRVMVYDIEGITASHIHQAPAGENGPVIFPLFTGSGDFDAHNPISGMIDLSDENIFDLLSADYYINVHTAGNPSGEIRGQIGPYEPPAHFETELTGDQEVPPLATMASGMGNFTLDSVRSTLHYYLSVSDISAITAAHIHLGPRGQNGPVIFGLYSGSGLFDSDHPLGSGLMLNAQNLVDLLTGYYYVNIHTEEYPYGEIRGQLWAVGRQGKHDLHLPLILHN